MKTSIIITDKIKQIVLAPETDNEKEALKMFDGKDDLEIMMKRGSFHNEDSPYGSIISTCEGGWLRAYSDNSCRIFTLKPKEKKPTQSVPAFHSLDVDGRQDYFMEGYGMVNHKGEPVLMSAKEILLANIEKLRRDVESKEWQNVSECGISVNILGTQVIKLDSSNLK